jgi:Uncharacterized protein conserved in bacteria
MASPRTVRPVTFFDAVLIAALIACSLFFFPLMQNNRAVIVAVIRDNATIATYPLSPDCRVIVRGRTGLMELEIKDKAVRVVSSTCPRQVCLFAGSIGRAGQQIICSPNHILIEILSSRKDGPDAITR